MSKVRPAFGLSLSLVISALMFPDAALAQFSKGYKFLESVRKRNGNEVNDALNEPGTTLVNTRDSTSGETALHIVTARRDLTYMSVLISKGANVNARDVRGVTPLELATRLGFQEGAQMLVDQRARVDEPNTSGETPLITAVHRRDVAMMRILLKAGASPDRADNSGRSARDYALLEGRSNPLISEIENNARRNSTPANAARPSYGPNF